MTTDRSFAIAGGAIADSLLDLLVQRGVIAKEDADDVIGRAKARLVILSREDRDAAQELFSSLADQIATRI
jgi:hypothetical protein